jgi:nitronate monooxygenase
MTVVCHPARQGPPNVSAIVHTPQAMPFSLAQLEHPIVQAPLGGGASTPALAAAVSAAGGVGSFGGIHVTEPPGWVTDQAALVRERTDRPFAIGFITPFLEFTEPYFEAALDARPAAVAFSFSDPGAWAPRAKAAGCRVICQVQSFSDAELAVDAGADVLVAQGTEAGGHTGTMSLLPLLAGVAEAHPDVVLLAAGGIGSGRTLAASLLAGADGAWLGTAFLATHEAVEVDDDYKAAIVASDGGDTVFTRAYDIASGLPWPPSIGERVRRDAFTDEWAEREAELRRMQVDAPPDAPVLYGQSARSVGSVVAAAEVVRRVSDDAEELLRHRPPTLLHDAGR